MSAAAAVAAASTPRMPTTAAAAAVRSAPAPAPAPWPTRPKRRRWFKVVAVVMSRRGGKESHRFVDINNGVSEFHFGRTTTRYDGSLLVGPAVPAHGFEVHESVHAALSAPFPADARHLHAPRALLEVLVGGQPMVVDGRIFFVQLTPAKLLADPERYAELHHELFGDAYYLPAPPLATPATRDAASPTVEAGCTAADDEPRHSAALSAAISAITRAPWPALDADEEPVTVA